MNLNKRNLRKIILLFFLAAVIFWSVQNITAVAGALVWVLRLIFPFMLGASIAFVLNVPMSWFERLFRFKRPRLKRVLCLFLTLIFIAGILFFVIVLVLPELGRTFVLLGENFPGFWETLKTHAQGLFEANPWLEETLSGISLDWESIQKSIFGLFRTGMGNVLNTTVSTAISLVNGVASFFIALVFSFYILYGKDKLGNQIMMVMRAYLPQSGVDKIRKIATLSYKTFSRFLSGQVLEALILGVLFFISMTVFRMPYALMISVLISICALIPIFGAFAAFFVGTFLILTVNPLQALLFAVLFLVLQQIEGNLIYPHVVGNSVGLPSIWVLAAVVLGGKLLGIVGMLIFVPLCSVLYALFREDVVNRIKKKKEKAGDRGNGPDGSEPAENGAPPESIAATGKNREDAIQNSTAAVPKKENH